MGESYWRTNHQIVGAFYCIKHGVVLKDSKVLKTDNKAEFLCADEEVCNALIESDPYSKHIKELNLQYIYHAEKLINNTFPKKDLHYINSFYIDRLREKGLASKNGSLYILEIQEQFLEHFPEQYLKMMQSTIDPEKPSNWLRLFVRNNGKNRSPLRHLLFM
ncbi:TnsD family Tn7-like transposition protein [Neobacillus sp.]|uniref:TnsD family Tn7-like transposition protein n=1 Tax=Neobacillus sp. TaxID=2675273 RepID=UPI0035B4FF2E